MPDEPEAAGLLALMLLNESRVAARSVGGAIVLLQDQDRTGWDRTLIEEGHTIVRDCIRVGRPGPFQVQAAIQAVHCHAGTFEATNWSQIVTLYDHLYSLMPSPVVALNRAIAIAEIDSPAAALTVLDGLGPELENYYPLHAARAATLRRLGRSSEAKAAYERAATLTTSKADRQFFVTQINELAKRNGTDSSN